MPYPLWSLRKKVSHPSYEHYTAGAIPVRYICCTYPCLTCSQPQTERTRYSQLWLVYLKRWQVGVAWPGWVEKSQLWDICSLFSLSSISPGHHLDDHQLPWRLCWRVLLLRQLKLMMLSSTHCMQKSFYLFVVHHPYRSSMPAPSLVRTKLVCSALCPWNNEMFKLYRNPGFSLKLRKLATVTQLISTAIWKKTNA